MAKKKKSLRQTSEKDNYEPINLRERLNEIRKDGMKTKKKKKTARDKRDELRED